MNTSKQKMIMAMTIFGTIGIIRKYIPIDSALLALLRGIIGSLFLGILYIRIPKTTKHTESKRTIVLLLLSGACIGINWMFLFESYSYTSVATATLCYYMAPIFVMLISPLLHRTLPTKKNLICIVVAFIGMLLVSNIFGNHLNGRNDYLGILYGVLAAILYASVILLNQYLKIIDAYKKTFFQLASAACILLPYVLGREHTPLVLTLPTILLILVVGCIHTGLAYMLYFDSMKDLDTQSIALLSYIDPILAIILSAVLLHEPLGISEIIGAICILGATMYNELSTDFEKCS